MNIQHKDFDNQLFTSDVSTSELLNFEVRGKNFKPGWYTCENFNGIPTFWLVYEDIKKNITRITNCGLMLELFKELPANATVNAHTKPQVTEDQKADAWAEFEAQQRELDLENNFYNKYK